MNTSMIVYRLFDVADEINLDLVQALWTSRNKIASRLRLDRISTKSITFKDPPVLLPEVFLLTLSLQLQL